MYLISVLQAQVLPLPEGADYLTRLLTLHLRDPVEPADNPLYGGVCTVPLYLLLVNFELGLSELSCASTGEHAERSASRSRCLTSQDFVFFTSVLFNCVFLLVRD